MLSPSSALGPLLVMEKYRVIEQIGKGAYGSAFLVERKADSYKCVLKTMTFVSMNDREKDAALQEVKILQSLNHPNVVHYLDSFHHEHDICLVMEYCNNGDLFGVIQKCVQRDVYIDEGQIIEWFTQLALAIAYLHKHHILHRDLKTKNIFIHDGVIKVGDFGISRVLEHSADLAITVVGTPYYMAPEVVQNQAYGGSADLWSCGIILYEMAAKEHPFSGSNMVALAGKILNSHPQPLPKSFSAELNKVVTDLLTKDAKKRPGMDTILKRPLFAPYVELHAQLKDGSCKKSPGNVSPNVPRRAPRTLPPIDGAVGGGDVGAPAAQENNWKAPPGAGLAAAMADSADGVMMGELSQAYGTAPMGGTGFGQGTLGKEEFESCRQFPAGGLLAGGDDTVVIGDVTGRFGNMSVKGGTSRTSNMESTQYYDAEDNKLGETAYHDAYNNTLVGYCKPEDLEGTVGPNPSVSSAFARLGKIDMNDSYFVYYDQDRNSRGCLPLVEEGDGSLEGGGSSRLGSSGVHSPGSGMNLSTHSRNAPQRRSKESALARSRDSARSQATEESAAYEDDFESDDDHRDAYEGL